MPDSLLSFADVSALVQAHASACVSPLTEAVPLGETQGRVLAAVLVADRDQPPFARSTRDGFAVRAAEFSAGMSLRIAGALRAGEVWQGAAMQSGEAIEIMTGAPVPHGADAVAMVEHVQILEGAVHAALPRIVRHGENIVPQGAEARAGDSLLAIGTRMQASEIALAASVGASVLPCFVSPSVAILSTGDELVAVEQQPAPHQIRNSNSHGLAALVRANGGTPRLQTPVPDDRHAVEQAIASARGADLLLLSGGVSAGKYDFVEEALSAHGAEFFFTGVRMQPGKPVVFGRLPATPEHPAQFFFGLPGNPVSTQVTFLLFAAPLLRALGGEQGAEPLFVQAVLTQETKARPGLTRFLPARLTSTFAGATVALTGWQGSGDLNANARANCYCVLEEGRVYQAGDVATCLIR